MYGGAEHSRSCIGRQLRAKSWPDDYHKFAQVIQKTRPVITLAEFRGIEETAQSATT